MSAAAALALGCLLQAPWNSFPVIDCNEGPRLYGAELNLKDGRNLTGYVALAKPKAPKSQPHLTLYKPDCGLIFFQDPDVELSDEEADEGECLVDEFSIQKVKRAWLPREGVLDIPAKRIKSLSFKPGPWGGISTERFLVLNAAERKILRQNGVRVPLSDYQGSGRMELAGGKGVEEKTLWAMAKPVGDKVKAGGKKALAAEKKRLLAQGIVLLFFPDVEP